MLGDGVGMGWGWRCGQAARRWDLEKWMIDMDGKASPLLFNDAVESRTHTGAVLFDVLAQMLQGARCHRHTACMFVRADPDLGKAGQSPLSPKHVLSTLTLQYLFWDL